MKLTRGRLLLIGSGIAFLVAALLIVIRGDRSRDLVLAIEPLASSSELTVYVGGAVAAPGLYTLPVGSRLAAALERAGVADDADVTTVPMAALLRDGQQIIVPRRTAALAPVREGSPIAATGGMPAVTPVATPAGPINVNTASARELESLPGVGPVLAARIVDYRNAHGPFADLAELEAVRGISARMIDDFRAVATVGP